MSRSPADFEILSLLKRDTCHIRGRLSAVIAVAGFHQFSFLRRLPTGRVRWFFRLRPLETLRSAGVVFVLVLATIVTGATLSFADIGDAAPKNDLSRYPVKILSNPDHVTVSWQIRSQGKVRLRLYREQLSGDEILVNEVVAQPGVSSFEFVDAERPPGNTVYVLRVLRFDGNEKTLGSALCVESQFSQCSIPVTSTVSHHSVRATERNDWLRILSWPFETVESVTKSGWIRGPDPPVPRRA